MILAAIFSSWQLLAAPAEPPVRPTFESLLALNRPWVADRLQLSAEQRARIEKAVESFQSQLQQIHRGYPRGAQDREGLEIRRKLLGRLAELRETTSRSISEILTDELRLKLSALRPDGEEEKPAGAPVRIEESRFSSQAGSSSAAEGRFTLKVRYSKAELLPAAGGKPVGPLWHAEQRLISCYAFSPDGRLVAAGSGKISTSWKLGEEHGDEGEVRVWNVATGKLVASKGFAYYVVDVRFSDDGKRVLVKTEPVNGR